MGGGGHRFHGMGGGGHRCHGMVGGGLLPACLPARPHTPHTHTHTHHTPIYHPYTTLPFRPKPISHSRLTAYTPPPPFPTHSPYCLPPSTCPYATARTSSLKKGVYMPTLLPDATGAATHIEALSHHKVKGVPAVNSTTTGAVAAVIKKDLYFNCHVGILHPAVQLPRTHSYTQMPRAHSCHTHIHAMAHAHSCYTHIHAMLHEHL